MELTDAEISTALKNGNEKVYEHLFRTYYSRLCNYADSLLKEEEEAEEIVQQIFLKLWEKRMELTGISSFKSYLYRMVYNACLNRIRHEKVRRDYADDYKNTTSEAGESSAKKVVAKELEGLIAEAIDKLPEQCRMVFKLSRFEELKYSEIADHLGISIKTVENHMGKALKILRTELRDYLPVLLILLPWLFKN